MRREREDEDEEEKFLYDKQQHTPHQITTGILSNSNRSGNNSNNNNTSTNNSSNSNNSNNNINNSNNKRDQHLPPSQVLSDAGWIQRGPRRSEEWQNPECSECEREKEREKKKMDLHLDMDVTERCKRKLGSREEKRQNGSKFINGPRECTKWT